jgi:integrase
MMARTKKGQLSYSAGEKRRNRVRVFLTLKTGMIQMEWRENGSRRTKSLKHDDWEKAKRQADEFTVNYVEPEKGPEPKQEHEPQPEPPTLDELFDIYGEEVTPGKSERTRKHDEVAMRMFRDFFGTDRDPMTLSYRDAARFVKERSAGLVGPSGKPVRARTVERDIRLLFAVLNWAMTAGDGAGGVLLQRNVLKGFKPPKEKNPLRVALTQDEYEALLGVAGQVGWRFKVALVVAHETGHRIGAIRQLMWSDIDLEGSSILWRAEHEKTGFEHVTPMTPELKAVLNEALRLNPRIGDAPILPGVLTPCDPVHRYLPRKWWRRAERLAGLERKRGRGWHSLRRKFATDLMHKPLKVLCRLGGWKSHETLLECYQQPDEEQMREALAGRRRATG